MFQDTSLSYHHYDAFGRRIAKTSKIEQLNKLNQRGELVKHPTALLHLRKTDKTEHSTTLMLWEGNRQIQEYTDNFVFTTVYDDESFEPVARVVQSRQAQDKTQGNTQGNDNDKVELFKIYHYHNNHLGTPQELTDENGEVVWANYEFAWGGSYQRYYKEQFLNNIAIDKDHLQPLRFQGQFFDQETSLHYNRFRYYDSDVGMFISRDPIGLLGGVNVFAYAPNPIHWVDVLGLKSVWQKNWEAKYGTLPKDYEVHHIIPKESRIANKAKKLCSSFDEHQVDNLIALPKNSSVAKINKPGFGKTIHSGYHKGYSMAVEKLIDGAIRLKTPNLSGCIKLSAIQKSLKNSLENDSLSLYKPNTKSNINEVVRP